MLVGIVLFLGNDLRLPIKLVLDLFQKRSGVDFIGKEMTQSRKTMASGVQEQWGSDAIDQVGGMNLNG